jgi:hypothetical protein
MKKAVLLSLLGWVACLAQTTYIGGERVIQNGVNVCTESGSGNSFVCAMPSGNAISAYAPGVTYSFVATHANTGGAAPTLAIDGLSPLPINGSSTANSITSGSSVVVTYNGSTFDRSGQTAGSVSGAATGPSVSASAPLYLYAHFRDDDPSLYMSYSYDGLNFKNMSPNAMEGQNVVRDPSVMYLNGTFYFLSTSGTNGRWVYWTSTDLINFSARQDLNIAGLASSTTTWAPEWFTDPSTGNIYGVGSVIIGGVAGVYKAPWTPTGGFGTGYTNQSYANASDVGYVRRADAKSRKHLLPILHGGVES